MADVSPVLQGFGSYAIGQQLLRGSQEIVMAGRGKEQLAVVALCFFTSVLKRETQDVDG